MRKRISHLLVLTALLGAVSYGIFHIANTAEAQTYTTTTSTVMAYPAPSGCLILPYSLGIGNSGSYVFSLQTFLNQQGHMSYPPTGYYGVITLASVARFQAAHGISAIGYVGPLTRARIQAISCSGGSVPTPGPISISSITPSAGPVGTQVAITGTGFTNDNTVYFAGGVIPHVPATTIYTYASGIVCTGYPNCTGLLQSLTFTVPEYVGPYCASGGYCSLMPSRLVVPGVYDVSVGNEAYGQSNSLQFTVTGPANTGQPLSIAGIDAPSQLSLATPGTWTVRVSGAQGNLHYSVLWGDEGVYASAVLPPSAPMSVGSSATFSHAYYRTGTYTPLFTVSDDYGHTVTTSVTVVVTSHY